MSGRLRKQLKPQLKQKMGLQPRAAAVINPVTAPKPPCASLISIQQVNHNHIAITTEKKGQIPLIRCLYAGLYWYQYVVLFDLNIFPFIFVCCMFTQTAFFVKKRIYICLYFVVYFLIFHVLCIMLILNVISETIFKMIFMWVKINTNK